MFFFFFKGFLSKSKVFLWFFPLVFTLVLGKKSFSRDFLGFFSALGPEVKDIKVSDGASGETTQSLLLDLDNVTWRVESLPFLLF